MACGETSENGPDTLADGGGDAVGIGVDGATTEDSGGLTDTVVVDPETGPTDSETTDNDGDSEPPLELPTEAQKVSVAVDWAINGTPGESGVLLQSGLHTNNGDVLVTAYFSGRISVGESVVVADSTQYTHVVGVRVSSEGEIRYMRHVCDGCSGALGEAKDGTVAMVSFSPAVVGNPGTAKSMELKSDSPGISAVLLSPEGEVTSMAWIGQGPGATIRAVTATADGGWLIGGDSRGMTFADGTQQIVADSVFWPGQAFIVKLNSELGVEWVELITGTAASTVSMIREWGSGFVVIGDFGGYPLGVVSQFGDRGGVSLEALSSDDDPAMDIFLTRWASPGNVMFARRVQHYTNGPRNPTWATVEGDILATRFDSMAELELDEEQHYTAGYGTSGVSLGTTWDADGTLVESVLLPYGALPVPESPNWGVVVDGIGSQPIVVGKEPDTLTFEAPETTLDLSVHMMVLGLFHPDGAVGKAGAIKYSYRKGQYPTYAQVQALQGDGSMMMVLNGSASITVNPESPVPISLPNSGYERLMFVKLSLGGWGF